MGCRAGFGGGGGVRTLQAYTPQNPRRCNTPKTRLETMRLPKPEGLGFLGFRVWGLGFRVLGVWGLGFRVFGV